MNTPPSTQAHPLALLAHELRTPLNALIGYADAMRSQVFGPVGAPYDEHAGVIYRAAQHLLALVDDMTDLARAEAGAWTGRRERVDLAALAGDVLRLLAPRAAAAGVAARLDAGPGDLILVADRRAMTQILVNLLDNAVKFTGAGGEIVLTLAREGPVFRLVVADSGPGPQAEADGTSAGGQGLGLRLVAALCAVHGGALTLETSAGGGFVATVSLPLAMEA